MIFINRSQLMNEVCKEGKEIIITAVFLARIGVLRYTNISCKPDNRQQNIEESFVLLPLVAEVNCVKIINNLLHAHF
jgi:hypothetical protein